MDELDATDIAILRELQKNAKLTIKELALSVHRSPTPVFERVKYLEKNGYIRQYIAVLDAEKLNKGFCVFCNVKLMQHSRENGKKFKDAILATDEVWECYNISGDFDFLLKVRVPDMKHYQNFVLNKLGEINAIGSLQSIFVMSEIKQEYGIPLSNDDKPTK